MLVEQRLVVIGVLVDCRIVGRAALVEIGVVEIARLVRCDLVEVAALVQFGSTLVACLAESSGAVGALLDHILLVAVVGLEQVGLVGGAVLDHVYPVPIAALIEVDCVVFTVLRDLDDQVLLTISGFALAELRCGEVGRGVDAVVMAGLRDERRGGGPIAAIQPEIDVGLDQPDGVARAALVDVDLAVRPAVLRRLRGQRRSRLDDGGAVAG